MPVDWKDPEAYNRLFAAMLAANDMKVSLLASHTRNPRLSSNTTEHLLFLYGVLCRTLFSIKPLFMLCKRPSPALALRAGTTILSRY